MSEFKHTPEPWFLLENRSEFEIWTEPDPLNSSTAKLIATVWKPGEIRDPEIRKFICDDSEFVGNAHLLLVAARMLRAIRLLCKQIPQNATDKEAAGIHQGNITGERLLSEILRELDGAR